MDKYFKIQKLIEHQKNRKLVIEKIFQDNIGFLPNMETDFKLEKKISYENLGLSNEGVSFVVKLKIKEKSSVRFVVEKNKKEIQKKYQDLFPEDILVIS